MQGFYLWLCISLFGRYVTIDLYRHYVHKFDIISTRKCLFIIIIKTFNVDLYLYFRDCVLYF